MDGENRDIETREARKQMYSISPSLTEFLEDCKNEGKILERFHFSKLRLFWRIYYNVYWLWKG